MTKGDTVKHDLIKFEMKVISTKGSWVTCEWTDENGFRVEQQIEKSYLTLVKSGISMLDAM